MSSRSRDRRRRVFAALAVAGLLATGVGAAGRRELRVCADPNNLPFSNRRGEGFENRIAELVAGDLHARVRYTWWPQRRGFFRQTLDAGRCDLVMGVPADLPSIRATRPYYRSTYVFVTRADRPLRVRSFDDPVLRGLRIGVQLAGDDGGDPPPVYALTRRGFSDGIVGYSLYADYARPNPPARIMDAVARGDVDVAVAWGPLAGYFAAREGVPLRVVPVSPQIEPPGIPLAFSIAMGVRKGDVALHAEVDRAIGRRWAEIQRVLDRYGVPRAPAGTES